MEIEQQLERARERLRAAGAALAPKHTGGEWEEYDAASDDVLRLERELAKARQEPYAVPFEFPVAWDVGAPLPFLLCSDYRTFLTFYVSDPDPNWDGSYVSVVDPASEKDVSLCLVEFHRCLSAKLGYPNEDQQGAHYLEGRGLDGYTAQIVMNSPWLAEVTRTSSGESARRVQHYVFWFHDSTFECLAESFDVELSTESMSELLARVQARLMQ